MSEASTAAQPPAAEVENFKVSPIALQSIACVRALQELAANGEIDPAQALLSALWRPICDHLRKIDLSALKDKDEQDAITLGACLAVLSGYFACQGNFRKMREALEHSLRKTHSELTPENFSTIEGFLQRITADALKHARAGG